jgi:simple sugar transport system ATP-binding protein/ribose transport system ATP-binding protein
MTDPSVEAVPRRTAANDDLEVVGISKRFGGAPALTNVSLTIRRGAVHALVGENGAGKSTLGKIISGVHSPDAGEILVSGDAVSFRSPRDAMDRGIVTIAQELAIVPYLSVIENVFLGAEPRRWGFVQRQLMRRRYDELIDRVGFRLPASQMAGTLVTADQQKLEILRALARDASTIIMDEPSAALPMHEVYALHGVIRSLAASGTTVILISHFLSEVLDLADTITILRDGRLVRTVPANEATESSLIEGMLGRSLGQAFPNKVLAPDDAPVVLEVEELSAPGVRGVSLQVRAGEIVGLAGLVGSGRSEFAHALFGATRVTAGRIAINGVDVTHHSPHQSLRQGVTMIPESRKDQGLLMGRPISENVSLASLGVLSRLGVMSPSRERDRVASALKQVRVKMASVRTSVNSLSGGNQQKVLFARTALCAPRVLIADEPTRGVDVGSKRTIYDVLVEQAEAGLGIIVISSELEEVLGLAHRVVVMRDGRFVAELAGAAMTQQAILEAAFAEPATVAS